MSRNQQVALVPHAVRAFFQLHPMDRVMDPMAGIPGGQVHFGTAFQEQGWILGIDVVQW